MALARMKRCLAGGLDLSEFLAEILNKNIVKASTQLRGLLADKLEALV
jgi:hypothetical protein